MGPTIAKDCVEDPNVTQVTGCDIDEIKLKAVEGYITNQKFKSEVIDVSNYEQLIETIKGHDVVVNCSAAKFSISVLKAAMSVKANVVDLAGGGYPQEGEIYEEVEKSGILAIPGCGVDPGLVDILAGNAMIFLDEVTEVSFACGGLPRDPVPPLDYKIVFGGTKMPIRPGKVPMIVDGKLTEVDRYSDIEPIFVDNYRDMEAFYDGYPSSLLKLCLEKKVKSFKGKTIRYQGFVSKLMFLLDLGVISDRHTHYKGLEIIPLDFFHELIYPIVKFDEAAGDRDITVMLVRASGNKKDIDVDVTYDMVDEYDEQRNITSMAKTTGFTAAIIARMVGRGAINKKGIQWPVRVIFGDLCEELLLELKKRGVEITETITKTRSL